METNVTGKSMEFQLVETEATFKKWNRCYKPYGIRYYWIPDTYYELYYKGYLVGVCGLHKLRKEGHYLMRGDYIIERYRKGKFEGESKPCYHQSIEFRIDLAKKLGAKYIWVRCNNNSINTYKKYGFKVVVDIGKQYTPLCLSLAY